MAKKQSIVFLLALLLFVRCANQLPPRGGEVDKIPPQINSIYPDNGTINFSDQFIEITFSEYVDKRSVKDALFISPTVEGEIDYSWTGKSIEVYFENGLVDSTTYSVTIGTDVKDVHNSNNMAEPFTFAFATGDKIDVGEISGKVFTQNAQGILIFAYRILSDTLNLLRNKPNYISQVGDNGKFLLTGLANGDYKLIAVRDEFRDYVYNIGEDQFGTTFKYLELTEKDSILSGCNFKISKEDTLSPHLFGATMTDRNHILVEFSEAIDSTQISAANFFIHDSTRNKNILLDYFFKGKAGSKQFYLAFKDSLIQENITTLNVLNLQDKTGNILEKEVVDLTVNDSPDSLKPSVVSLEGNINSTEINPYEPKISISFDDGISKTALSENITVYDKDSNFVAFKLEAIDNSAFELIPNNNLLIKSFYEVVIFTGNLIDVAGNKGDSVYSKKLTTLNSLDFSGVSGTYISSTKYPTQLILEPVERKNNSVYQTKGMDEQFKFTNILPGKYILWAFEDANSNSKYDFGNVEPFKLSEKFVYYSDTLNLRARWPVGDIELKFD